MTAFFDQPILNSPYAEPQEHWELDKNGLPTDRIVPRRRRSELLTPIPKPKKQTGKGQQTSFVLDIGHGLSTEEQEYNPTVIINDLRQEIERWRALPNPDQWQVTPVTATLLRHWRALRDDATQAIRPFFCQLEAVETAIWLHEVAPRSTGWQARQPAVVRALENLNKSLTYHDKTFPVGKGGRAGQSLDFRAAGEVTLPSGEPAPAGGLMEREVPRDAPPDWPDPARAALARFWGAASPASRRSTPRSPWRTKKLSSL